MIETRKVRVLREADVQQKLELTCAGIGISGRKLLAIIPDNTRTAPIGLFFKAGLPKTVLDYTALVKGTGTYRDPGAGLRDTTLNG